MIDFNKPLEVQESGSTEWKPARVLGTVKYANFLFTHAVAITHQNGSESVHAAQTNGYVEDGFKLRNTPKVVTETWYNVYKSGKIGGSHPSQVEADVSQFGQSIFGYYVTKKFDDGSRTNEFIPVN